MITKLFPSRSNVYARGPVGENVLHTAMLLNTPSTLAIARYLVKLYGPPLVNCPFTVGRTRCVPASSCARVWSRGAVMWWRCLGVLAVVAGRCLVPHQRETLTPN
jgi:hypothetical protein